MRNNYEHHKKYFKIYSGFYLSSTELKLALRKTFFYVF